LSRKSSDVFAQWRDTLLLINDSIALAAGRSTMKLKSKDMK